MIDIRVDLPSGTTLDMLRPAVEAAKTLFPIERPTGQISMVFDTQENKSDGGSVTQTGFALTREDGDRVIQFRLDGFTLNQLKPYPNWEEFEEEAFKWWDIYSNVAKPDQISKIGLRYINRLLLPENDLEKYFFYRPVSPRGVEGEFTHFLQQVRIEIGDSITALVTQTMESSLDEAKLPVIFDIDTVKTGPFQTNDPELKAYFAVLHEIKNKIFFENLTEEALKLCS